LFKAKGKVLVWNYWVLVRSYKVPESSNSSSSFSLLKVNILFKAKGKVLVWNYWVLVKSYKVPESSNSSSSFSLLKVNILQTDIMLVVRVPVLSEQMTEVQPKVSTEGKDLKNFQKL